MMKKIGIYINGISSLFLSEAPIHPSASSFYPHALHENTAKVSICFYSATNLGAFATSSSSPIDSNLYGIKFLTGFKKTLQLVC